MDCKLHLYPKVYNPDILFVMDQKLWVLQLNFDGWFQTSRVQTFQPIIIIYNRGKFVYYHWGFISIYSPLSYPLRSLEQHPLKKLGEVNFNRQS